MTMLKQSVPSDDSAATLTIQVAKNTMVLNVCSNILLIVLNAGVSILLAPYLINRLGVAAYGMVALANSFPSYLQIASLAITNTLCRFVSINMAQNKPDQANIYYNTSFKAIVIINGLLFLPAMFFATFFSRLFDVPLGQEWQSNALVGFTLIACLVSALVSTSQVVYPLLHKFYLQNILLAIARIISVVFLFSCFFLFKTNLMFVGMYQLIYAAVGLALIFAVQLRFQNSLRLRRGLFDYKALREMGNMSFWVLLNDLSSLLFLLVGYIVINKTMGAEATGRFGPVMLINALLVMLAGAVGSVLLPIFYAFVGKDNTDALSDRLTQTIRLMSLLLGAPVVILCGLSKPILALWIGPSFADLWPLLWLVTMSMWVGGICFIPVGYLFLALDSMPIPAMINSICGVLHIVAVLLLIKCFGLGLISFGISFAFLYGIRGFLSNSIYASTLLKHHFWYFMRPVATIIPVVGICSIVGMLLSNVDSSWFGPAANLLLIAFTYIVLGYFIILSKEDKRLLTGLFLKLD